MYENYCRIRDLKGLKDADVARIAKIPKSTFSEWKNGRSCPKQEKLQKIADALGVSFSALLNLDEQPLEVPQYHPAIQDFIDLLPRLTEDQIKTLIQTAQLFAASNAEQ